MPARPPFAIIVPAAASLLGIARAQPSADARTNSCRDALSVAWEPAIPRRGALFRIRVVGAPEGALLTGVAGGEGLHFARDTAGGPLESLAPTSIDGPDAIDVAVYCSMGSLTDTIPARVATAAGDYAIERLRVAPAFARPPDSATAERIRRESQRAAEVGRTAHATPRLWRAPFTLPRDSRVTSGFGRGREFNGTVTSRHMGTDFAGVTGAPVRAVNRGVVRIVDSFHYGGKVIYVDHGAGLSSAYLHLSLQHVAAGDTVERGVTIGLVGATGRVTGAHLHLIVRYGSLTVDPVSLFDLTGDPRTKRR